MTLQTKVVFVLLLSMAASACGSSSCCPEGWEKVAGRCFKYQPTRMDWASAEKYCLDHGGNLASIHSDEEYRGAKSIIHAQDPSENPTWIGLSSCTKPLNWFWSDGTPFTFTKWNPGEPNSLPGEWCVHMNFPHPSTAEKNWNDIPCGQTYPFLCVRDSN